jgi:aminoglycoside phosphotransferase (APT) family kinase protein
VVDVAVAEDLGRALGTWQRATADDPAVAAEFGDTTAFGQLRVDPFHRTVAGRHPDLADVVERTIADMAASSVCLVHGDYTPKNVLVGSGAVWVIDWEVAHVGDPTFDPAWTIGHLLLKTVHRPGSAENFAAAGHAFLTALDEALDGALALDPEQLVRQLGCLLLARVDGKSPADYLTDDERPRVRALARRLLTDPPATALDAWELLA